MIIQKEKYCIASSSFPLRFYKDGNETDILDDDVLHSYNDCEKELKTYDNFDDFQILHVKVTYEL